MKPTFYAAALIAISAAAFLPAQSMAQVGVNIVIGNAPPPLKFESVPQARRGYVWAPGYWNWDGQRHVWAAGEWQPERSGSRYRSAEWVRENNNWRLNRGGWISTEVQAVRYDYVQVAPPPPRHERMPRPRQGYLWSPGHWEWRGQRHDWVSGAWIAERPGYVYSSANWTQRDGHWYMEPGRWQQHGDHGGYDGRGNGRGNGDRDRDGIPNRYDRDRNNDGVPDRRDHDRDHDGISNRHDRDRDGDGVPNRQDNRPDNPRRN